MGSVTMENVELGLKVASFIFGAIGQAIALFN